MATEKDLLDLVPGQTAVISGCEAREHGQNDGCVCQFMGAFVTLGPRYATPFAGTPTWHLVGLPQRVRLSEITFTRPRPPLVMHDRRGDPVDTRNLKGE